MTRKSYVQCPKTFELIPRDEYVSTPRGDAPYIMPDIQPYQSMIDGTMITGRRQHREHLRQHGCIEVGNEKLTPSAPKPASSNDIKRDIHNSLNRLGL